MATDSDRMELLLQCLKIMESTALGLKQLRSIVPKGAATEVLEKLIKEAEARLAEVNQRLVQ